MHESVEYTPLDKRRGEKDTLHNKSEGGDEVVKTCNLMLTNSYPWVLRSRTIESRELRGTSQELSRFAQLLAAASPPNPSRYTLPLIVWSGTASYRATFLITQTKTN